MKVGRDGLSKARERILTGPGWGLTRIPGVGRVHELAASVVESLAPREARVGAFGFTFMIDPKDRQVGAELLRTGTYEPTETALWSKLVRPGMTVVDIGANIGVYTLLAARGAGPRGRVVAFEPAPATAALLQQNMTLNGFANVTIEQRAVARSSGEADLFLVERHSALASLSSYNARSSSDSISVPVVSLDDYFESSHVDLIKMDAQGAEGEIAAGAVGVIARCRPIVLAELWPAALESLGWDARSFLTLFADHDYDLATVDDPDTPLSVEQTLELAAATGGADIVLVPAEKER